MSQFKSKHNPKINRAAESDPLLKTPAPQLTTAQVKRYGMKGELSYKVRVFFNTRPYHYDSRLVHDPLEAKLLCSALLSRQAKLELAWPDTTQLDTIFSEAENEAAEKARTFQDSAGSGDPDTGSESNRSDPEAAIHFAADE